MLGDARDYPAFERIHPALIQEYHNLQSIKQKGTYRIMCLGESTTRREYPPFLEEILNQRNIGVRFSVIDKGRGAQTLESS